MDASRFDRLSRALAGAASRRGVVQAAAALALAGSLAGSGEAADARRGTGPGVSGEHWQHKKRLYCLDGKTVRRYRRKQKKLLALGATLGKCGHAPPCVPTTCEALALVCGAAPDGCGGTLQCSECDDGLACCAGQCVTTASDETNCGECGIVCTADETCFHGVCSIV